MPMFLTPAVPMPRVSRLRRLVVAVPKLEVCLAIVASWLALPPVQAADWRKLTDGATFSDVVSLRFDGIPDTTPLPVSADSRWVLYWHDRDVDEAYELYSARLDGSAMPTRISGLLPAEPTGGPAAISPDSATVVYSAEQDTNGVRELYSVPIAGGTITKLNETPVMGGNTVYFEIGAAGDRVVYWGDQDTNSIFELFSVPIHGGSVETLNQPVMNRVNETFRISPLGDRVVYTADPVTQFFEELFTVPVAGGTKTKLSDPVKHGRAVGFTISPSGDRVVYTAASLSALGYLELYSSPITGGGTVQLSAAVPTFFDFRISPSGDRVVYMAGEPGSFELYSVPIAGGSVAKLNGALPTGGGVYSFEMSPSGAVVYRSDQQSTDLVELFSVPITDGTPLKLNGPLTLSGDGGDVLDFKLTPDGEWVVYRADQTQNDVPILVRAPAAGPAGNDVVISTRNPQSASDWQIDPAGERVIALSVDLFSDTIYRPWSMPIFAPLDPGGEELVDESEFDPDGGVESFTIAPNGTIVYRADQETNDEIELYSITFPVFVDGFESGDVSAWD